MSNGKGSTPRPLSVHPTTYAANYARINWAEDTGYDARDKFCPPLDEAPTTQALRDKHLAEAKAVIQSAPPMSAETRAKLNQAWAAFDAAYPHELAPKDTHGDQ